MRVSENNRRKEHCTSAFLLFTKDKSTMSRFIFLRENGLKTSYDDFEHRILRNGFIRYFLAYANSVSGWVDLEKINETALW